MKNTTNSFIKNSLIALVASVLSVMMVLSLTSSAQALQVPYEDIGDNSFETPVFNTYTNVPNGVGNEADFVRIRPSTGDVANNGAGGVRNALYVNGQAADCSVGDQFDIRTYVHNGANEDFNDNGNGSAVANNTTVRMVAPLGTEGKTFTFTSTIGATDVSPVTDTARLFCETDENVMLKLVPQSVKVYASSYGYQNVSDSAVNGNPLPIGSRVAGSGDVWGCWAERVNVAYTVEVVEIPVEEPEPIYTCDLLSLAVISDRKFKFTTDATSKNGATIKSYSYDFGDDTKVTIDTGNMVEHTYAKEGTYKITATANFAVTQNGEMTMKSATSDDCMKQLTIKDKTCPIPGKEHLPADSKDCAEVKADVSTPIVLPNTGAGSIAGLLAVVTVAGAAAHRAFVLKRQ